MHKFWCYIGVHYMIRKSSDPYPIKTCFYCNKKMIDKFIKFAGE